MAVDESGKKLPHWDFAKYHNTLNNLAMDNFTSKELDIFWAVVTQLRDSNANKIVFSYAELMELIKPSNKSPQILTDHLERMMRDLMSLSVIEKDGRKTKGFTAIPEWLADGEKRTLTVEIGHSFKPYINQLAANFTRFSLDDYVKLKSKYAKKLFVHLMQYRTTGVYFVTKDQLYALLALTKNYRRNASIVDTKVLEPAVKELSKYFTRLTYKKYDREGKVADGKGQRVWQYRFTFEPEAPNADALAKKRAQIKKQLSIASQNLAEAKDSKEFEYQLQYVNTLSEKYKSLSDGLENVLDLEEVKVTDEQGNDINGDDKLALNKDKKFKWTPSEKYQPNFTAEKVSQEELERRIRRAKEHQEQAQIKENENSKPSGANQEDEDFEKMFDFLGMEKEQGDD